MSWSVGTTAKPQEAVHELDRQFGGPLAEKPAGLTDEGERETVRCVQTLLRQCLSTFGPDKVVAVSAYGHMGFGDWATKQDAYQEVTISIKPAS